MLPEKEVFARHLSGLVQFPTVSNIDEAAMDFTQFDKLHDYLRKTYPLVHKTFSLRIIGKAALLYHWKAENSEGRLPILLAAHQDVVPENDPSKWTWPPYEGKIIDNKIWGRGTLDCKSMLMGEMEALEALIAEGYQPKQDIYLAYGYNEEVGTTTARPSAKLMCEYLASQGVRLGLVIDEGGEIVPGKTAGVDCLLANIAVTEKGYCTLQVYKEGKAGHPAMPGNHCLMADVARAVAGIADYPRPYRVTEPMDRQYKILAARKPEMKEVYESLKDHMDWLAPRLDADPRTGAKFQTTLAMTTAEGSPSPSSLPSKVSVGMNVRLLEGDTVNGIVQDFSRIADKYGCKVKLIAGRDPSRASVIDDEIFGKFQKALDRLYDDIQVVPVICIGGTDAFYYQPICDKIYRFSGGRRHPDNGPSHGYDETYSMETIADIPNFFYQFLQEF